MESFHYRFYQVFLITLITLYLIPTMLFTLFSLLSLYQMASIQTMTFDNNALWEAQALNYVFPLQVFPGISGVIFATLVIYAAILLKAAATIYCIYFLYNVFLNYQQKHINNILIALTLALLPAMLLLLANFLPFLALVRGLWLFESF